LSAPTQSTQSSVPLRAANFSGHEIAKSASLPVSAFILFSNEHFNPHSTAGARASQFAAVALYARTHAFLI
jgi:hypothetical protein